MHFACIVQSQVRKCRVSAKGNLLDKMNPSFPTPALTIPLYGRMGGPREYSFEGGGRNGSIRCVFICQMVFTF